MTNTLDIIEVVTDYKHLQIREIIQVPRVDEDGNPVLDEDGNPIIDSGYHRRVLKCGDDVSGEVQEIKDRAEELWTDEVKTSWATFQAEEEARMKAEQEARMNPENA